MAPLIQRKGFAQEIARCAGEEKSVSEGDGPVAPS